MRPQSTLQPLEKRFFGRFQPVTETGCWLWQATVGNHGYGEISNGLRKPRLLAHRVSWQLHHGEIPNDLFVLHRCDVRCCVNPAHLFLGDAADNIRDASKKGRLGWKGPRRMPKGSQCSWAKLTDAEADEIRSSIEAGNALANKFEVSRALISMIRNNKVRRTGQALKAA